jgi:hypothetical protein
MRMFRLAALMFLSCLVSFAGKQDINDPGEPGVITGKVVTSDGHPLLGARVYVREHNRPQIGAIRYITTGHDGEFRIANLRPGDYDVSAVPSHSTSMLRRWTQRVHLPEDKPVGNVTIRVGFGKPRVNSFHEKAGRGQDTLRFFLSVSLFPFS